MSDEQRSKNEQRNASNAANDITTSNDTNTGAHNVAQEPVISVRDLTVSFASEAGTVHAVRGMNFDLYPGKTLGIVGESGAGKSDLEMSEIRGKGIAMVFQDPLSALTPVFSIGDQIKEALVTHNPKMTEQQIHDRSIELMNLVGIPDPEGRLKSFPHEFSGGMRQRVMIAMAIANDPDVIIADEPTTALDVTIQAQVLEVLRKAQRETGAAVIFITHDLGVIAGIADDIVVMYAGRPVEKADVDSVFDHPAMPYTMGMLGAVPRSDRERNSRLVPILGSPMNLATCPRDARSHRAARWPPTSATPPSRPWSRRRAARASSWPATAPRRS